MICLRTRRSRPDRLIAHLYGRLHVISYLRVFELLHVSIPVPRFESGLSNAEQIPGGRSLNISIDAVPVACLARLSRDSN